MATNLPSLPPTPPLSITSQSTSCQSLPSDHDLVSLLDSLFEKYLELLDKYTRLREQLSSQFSSGFLSLAHANRNAGSTLGAGRRYDQHGYDERMKASSGVRVTQEDALSSLQDDEQQQHKAYGKEHPENNERNDRPHSPVINFYCTYKHTSLYEKTSKNDPIRWYGVFVSPALRQCQASFSASVCETMPSLLTTVSEMKQVEQKIWHVRAKVGIPEVDGHSSVDKGFRPHHAL